jgi:hypothetical protein
MLVLLSPKEKPDPKARQDLTPKPFLPKMQMTCQEEKIKERRPENVTIA